MVFRNRMHTFVKWFAEERGHFMNNELQADKERCHTHLLVSQCN